jgi:hypothetical protein
MQKGPWRAAKALVENALPMPSSEVVSVRTVAPLVRARAVLLVVIPLAPPILVWRHVIAATAFAAVAPASVGVLSVPAGSTFTVAFTKVLTFSKRATIIGATPVFPAFMVVAAIAAFMCIRDALREHHECKHDGRREKELAHVGFSFPSSFAIIEGSVVNNV